MRDERGRITTHVREYDKACEEHMKNCDGCQVIKVCLPQPGDKWLCTRCAPPPRFASGGKVGRPPNWAKI